MPSVGPELPPHLAKRKRSIDDAEGPNSPPHKMQAAPPEKRVLAPAMPPAANPDELDINDSSDDDCGPSLPSKKSQGPTLPTTQVKSPALPTRGPVGPTLPPTTKPDAVDLEDISEDGIGPSVPIPKSAKAPSPFVKRRMLGPARPPGALSERPPQPANDDDSSSDDDYGPSLPPAPGPAAESEYLHALHLEKEQEAARAALPVKPKRDDWMLAPPSDSDWTSRVDPTKLKNRKFASGKGAKAPAEKGGGISALWTETPEEKRKRLQDEVLGRTEISLNSTSKASRTRVESKEDIETERRIREYNAKNRGSSLMEKRQREGGQKEEEDDPSKRGFDREKDMALGGQVSRVAKKDMLAKAADFGSRFQKGSYL
ncbi:hypothetical protein HYALB_00002529 [Hymenoscyphus albidus]|uniref:DUF3752 domain-containing protein n=1 Tax=Hymenoscyphus albidus TaxID=595503 RepID=A0A9N9LVK8_9HELO|nr:hypothetical protein HYALB_00002529 [Hymenoscyphus albidus]